MINLIINGVFMAIIAAASCLLVLKKEYLPLLHELEKAQKLYESFGNHDIWKLR